MAPSPAPVQEVVIILEPHHASPERDQLITIPQSFGGDYPRLASVGRDKPKTLDTAEDRALFETLKQHAIVSSYDVQTHGIKGNNKYKWRLTASLARKNIAFFQEPMIASWHG